MTAMTLHSSPSCVYAMTERPPSRLSRSACRIAPLCAACGAYPSAAVPAYPGAVARLITCDANRVLTCIINRGRTDVPLDNVDVRAAMAAAEVGDEQRRADPTVNRLQDRMAELLGKERAIFFPTGTMCNLVAVGAHTRPGDSIVIGSPGRIYRRLTPLGSTPAASSSRPIEVGPKEM